MSQFFARLFSMIATDAMVTALARNRRFQAFALRVDGLIKQNQKLAQDHADNFAKKSEEIMKDPEVVRVKAEQAAAQLKEKVASTGFTFARFVKAFGDEVRKDFGGGGGGNK